MSTNGGPILTSLFHSSLKRDLATIEGTSKIQHGIKNKTDNKKDIASTHPLFNVHLSYPNSSELNNKVPTHSVSSTVVTSTPLTQSSRDNSTPCISKLDGTDLHLPPSNLHTSSEDTHQEDYQDISSSSSSTYGETTHDLNQ